MARHKLMSAQIWSLIAFASYWCWTFCVLLTNTFTPGTDLQFPIPVDSWFISTLFHVVTLWAIWRASEAKLPFVTDIVLMIFGPPLCLVGLLLLAESSFVSPASLSLAVIGSSLSGMGTGFLAIAWARGFVVCCRDREKQRLLFLAIIAAAMLELVLSRLPMGLFVVVMAMLPLVSVVSSWMTQKSSSSRDWGRREAVGGDEGLAPRFIVFCLVFSIPLGMFQTGFSADFGSIGDWASVLAPSIALLIIVLIIDISFFKRRRINLSEKLIMPVMVAGLFALASFGERSMHVAGILVFVAQQIMSVVLYARFGVVASKGDVSPVKAFALGIISTDIGFMVGIAVGEAMGSLSSDAGVNIVLSIAYLMVVVAFFTVGGFIARSDKDTGKRGSLLQLDAEWLDELASSYSLTPREREMLDYLVRGKSVPAIASDVFLSTNTVRTHIAHIYQKFGVHSRDELLGIIEKLYYKN